MVQPFLEATPGLKELVILSRIVKLTQEFDQVIVDMLASGHAISLMGVPNVAIDLMRSGPIRDRADQILRALESHDTQLRHRGPPRRDGRQRDRGAHSGCRRGSCGRAPSAVVLNRAALLQLSTTSGPCCPD